MADFPVPVQAFAAGIAGDATGDFIKTGKISSALHMVVYGGATGVIGFYLNRWILNSLLGVGLSDTVCLGITFAIAVAQRQFTAEYGAGYIG